MQIIEKYFKQLSPIQQNQFAQLGELYRFWNEQINVVSRQDIDNLYERHVLHSLGIAAVMDFKGYANVLDVGTGGGFPGIPLAIMFPDVQFHLIDSIGKKIKVVQGVAESLQLANVRIEHIRAEQTDDLYDFVVCRAVTRLEPFIEWIKHKISKNSTQTLNNGILALKGGDLTDELKEIKRRYRVFELSDYFEEEFFETKKVIHVGL